MYKQNNKRKTAAQRISMYGICIALAMILSYVETLIPIHFAVPGVKPGLANLAVVAALYLMSPADAWVISVVRIVLVSFTFGNVAALMYSLAGAVLSLSAMVFCQKKRWLTMTGVSIVGGVMHNIGQLLMAAVVLESAAVFTYLPALLLAGVLAGALIGLLGGMLLKRLPRTF